MKRDYRDEIRKAEMKTCYGGLIWIGGIIAFCMLLGQIQQWCH